MARRVRLSPRPISAYLSAAVLSLALLVTVTVTASPAGAAVRRPSPTYLTRNHPPTPQSEVMRALQVSSAEFGVSLSRMTSIASCESGLNPFDSNGSHDGLLAQSRRYWPGRVRAFNQRHPNNPVSGTIWNAFDNARVSAEMMDMNPSLSDWEQCL